MGIGRVLAPAGAAVTCCAPVQTASQPPVGSGFDQDPGAPTSFTAIASSSGSQGKVCGSPATSSVHGRRVSAPQLDACPAGGFPMATFGVANTSARQAAVRP